jgi:hypothetical protein
MASVRRLCFLLSFVAVTLAGCSRQPPYDRKADIESWLPGYITSEMRHHPLPSTNNVQYDRLRCNCTKVTLTKESGGHYTGEAIFIVGKSLSVDVVDEGKNVQFKLSAMNDWGNGRVPPVD